MAESGKFYNVQLADQSASGKVYKVRDVTGEKNVSGKVYQVKGLGGGGDGGVTIKNQDKQITENGVYTADAGYTGLGTVNVNVPTGGGEPATKFGASVDTWIGDVDANGVLNKTTWTGVLNFVGVKKIGYNGMQNVFYYRRGITNVDLSSLQSVSGYGMYQAFYGCTGLTNVDLSSLQSVGDSGMYQAFYGCTGLTTMSFPSLTSVQSNGLNSVFGSCTNLTEIHFRADMQATIEAMSGYSSKFGATNASIIFDL